MHAGSQPKSRPCQIRYFFFSCRFCNRTPGPPPFSSMNSTPADFESACDHVQCGSSRGVSPRFELPNRYDADSSFFGQIRLAPIQQSARRPALLRFHDPAPACVK